MEGGEQDSGEYTDPTGWDYMSQQYVVSSPQGDEDSDYGFWITEGNADVFVATSGDNPDADSSNYTDTDTISSLGETDMTAVMAIPTDTRESEVFYAYQ